MGTAELACASLAALAQLAGFQVVAVVTQPDRPRGRALKLQPSPVKELAMHLSLSVLQPERAREPGFMQQLADLHPDLIVVAAYGQILPPAILALPGYGCLNVHTSLLPKYRGAAPIQWAILEGETETGVTLMKMDAGLDTGDILKQQRTPILATDNSQTLHDRLAALGAELCRQSIPEWIAGKIVPEIQPAVGASYARKITKEDGRLDWGQPAQILWHRIRAFTPWPGAYTFLPTPPKPGLLKVWLAETVTPGNGRPGEILQADQRGIVVACGKDSLRVLLLQREGGRRLNAGEYLSGHAMHPGKVLGGV